MELPRIQNSATTGLAGESPARRTMKETSVV